MAGFLGIGAVVLGAWMQADAGPQARIGFKTVKPILDAKCVSCHNAQRTFAQLNLTSYETLMKGGQHGSPVVPKNPSKSRLYRMITGTLQPRMPKGKPPLSAGEINKIKAWIAAGAKN